MNSLMLMVSICEDYGWTYEEYQNQPAFFLELVIEKKIRDNKEKELAYKKMKRG